MLVLTRKLQQQIQIGENITVTILQVKGHTVRVGIEAPRETRVLRAELPKKDLSDRTVEVTLKPAVKTAARTTSRRPSAATQSPLAKILARRASGVDPATQTRFPQRPGPASLLATS